MTPQNRHGKRRDLECQTLFRLTEGGANGGADGSRVSDDGDAPCPTRSRDAVKRGCDARAHVQKALAAFPAMSGQRLAR